MCDIHKFCIKHSETCRWLLLIKIKIICCFTLITIIWTLLNEMKKLIDLNYSRGAYEYVINLKNDQFNQVNSIFLSNKYHIGSKEF